jgi:uncharacterized protein YuzE
VKTRYDKSTDSLYVELRDLPAKRTVELEEDVMLDIGADGQPVGYDIQHASKKSDFIARLVIAQAAAE